MDGDNMLGGSLRLLFAFSAGLLLSRVFRPVHIRGAFWICGLAVVALLSVPRIGGSEHFYAWVKNENLTFTESLPGALALVAGSVILAYLCLKLYDEPVRRFLTDRFLHRKK